MASPVAVAEHLSFAWRDEGSFDAWWLCIHEAFVCLFVCLQVKKTCISFCFRCRDQMSDETQCTEGVFWLTVECEVHHGKEGMAAGAGGAGYIMPPVRSKSGGDGWQNSRPAPTDSLLSDPTLPLLSWTFPSCLPPDGL